jgi:hypothetical protein
MGEDGRFAIDNIRPTKKTCVNKFPDNDKDSRTFESQEEAIRFAFNVLRFSFKKRKNNNAPKTLLSKDGNNPSIDDIIKRWWGEVTFLIDTQASM